MSDLAYLVKLFAGTALIVVAGLNHQMDRPIVPAKAEHFLMSLGAAAGLFASGQLHRNQSGKGDAAK